MLIHRVDGAPFAFAGLWDTWRDPEGELIRLQPANPLMEAIRVPARSVKVQGVVVGLMRKF